MPTIAGLFDDYTDASNAVRELHAAGITNADISLVTADRGAAQPVAPSPVAEDIAGGVPESETHVYSEALRRGGSLVTAKVDAARADQARAILDDNDAVDINERRASYEADGWRGFDETAAPLTAPEATPPRTNIYPNI